jgi:hypothetical protein
MAKKEFFWDTEELIGTIKEGEKVEHDVKKCTKDGTEFVVVTKKVLKRDGWTIAKNQTFKKEVYNTLVGLVGTL